MSTISTLSSRFNIPSHPVDEVGIKERVARLATRSIKKFSKVEGLKLALSMVDLTTLEGADTPGRVRQLCTKAIHLHSGRSDLPMVAAVCVYPTMVRVAREALKGTPIKVAAVATAFPSGMNPLAVKLEDTRYAVGEGAHEIDMVISRGDFLRGDYARVADEIAEVKKACGKAHLKVILETGELGTLDRVRLASDIAMEAGADFIKTSTGKIQPAATPEVVLVMLQAISDFFRKTGKKIGMKPAGGIANAKAALNLLVMVREVLGPAWL
ncbi:deoxyribose-phosphate aldolase, partial [bacterium]|nr:deoxyribose-phosphate aldolase [bacterium]